MKNKIVIITLCLLSQIKVVAQSCLCSSEEKRLVFKNSISICGSESEEQWSNAILLSELTIKNCNNKKYLIDNRLDATETFAINMFADSVTITSLQLIPDSTMQQLKYVPLSYKVLKLTSQGVPVIGKSKFIFNVPQISTDQKKYIDSFCLEFWSRVTHPLSVYPFDEISIYILFLGALNDYGKCYNIFVNLRKFYALDGAIAETKDEIPFDYIRNNVNKVANRRSLHK